ncbi:MAG: ABC transporter ATP-binding protein [Lachnospiraceae bacterium]|nr:ABC transporter ATP-binding protein [Lachnospiraceae bacterium]
MDKTIEIKNLRKVYRMGQERIVAINNISLDIYKNEICCLLGKSGSGKSTLLNLIAGLEKPTKGQIIFNEKHIEEMNENQLANFRKLNVGFVFQSYNLLPSLTALENVMLPLIFNRISKKERILRAKKLLKDVGLGERINHKPSEMSGGQQQRVSIARAFINNPNIVFADEPTGNLDTKTTAEMMELITGMVKSKSQTLVVVTHDLELAAYANRIINMSDGKIESISQN